MIFTHLIISLIYLFSGLYLLWLGVYIRDLTIKLSLDVYRVNKHTYSDSSICHYYNFIQPIWIVWYAQWLTNSDLMSEFITRRNITSGLIRLNSRKGWNPQVAIQIGTCWVRSLDIVGFARLVIKLELHNFDTNRMPSSYDLWLNWIQHYLNIVFLSRTRLDSQPKLMWSTIFLHVVLILQNNNI